MTTDPLEAELAQLTPEQRAQLEAQAALTIPVQLPVAFAVQPVTGRDGSAGVLMVTQTPAGGQRLVLTRDQSLALASQLRKAAQTGPALAVPPAAGRLVVPGWKGDVGPTVTPDA